MISKHQLCHRRSESGFSLITLVIALTVISLLMLPMIHMLNISFKVEKKARNQVGANIGSNALTKHFLLFGRYPYPSAPGSVVGSPGFGREAVKPPAGWPDCQNPLTPDTVVCATTLNTFMGRSVLIGGLPFAQLSLPFSSTLDANKNLLTYAVTEDLTAAATYTENGGGLIVIDDTNAEIYTAGARSHFVIVSHGDDSRGAFGLNGVRNVACGDDATSDDFENCNKDGRFRSNKQLNAPSPIINEAAGALHFDDYLQEKNSSISGIWSFTPNPLTPDLSINDRVGGNIMIGNCDGRAPCTPVSRFDIYGTGSPNTPAIRATSVRTKRICPRGNAAGDAPGTAAWNCVSDYNLASNLQTADPQLTTCIGTDCPTSTASWNSVNTPPWFTPQLILGETDPSLTESGSYWMSTADHGSFHRGNGILCIGNRSLNGIFDYDESCEDTTLIGPTSRAKLGNCPSGQYARGLKADGSFYCTPP